jgi:hypothetical protein
MERPSDGPIPMRRLRFLCSGFLAFVGPFALGYILCARIHNIVDTGWAICWGAVFLVALTVLVVEAFRGRKRGPR